MAMDPSTQARDAAAGASDTNMFSRLIAAIPTGRPLPEELWQRRHAVIIGVLWLHVVGLGLFGLINYSVAGLDILHVVGEVGLIALAAYLATLGSSRRWKAGIASFGLVTSSAVLVHFASGYIEFHFHFFVMLAVIVLYQDWVPFLLAIGYTALHHGVMGILFPTAVFNHVAAQQNPWLWALIHAVFVLAASLAHVASWQLADHQALHDSATGLPNREFFFDIVKRSLARTRLHGHPTGLLLVELRNYDELVNQFGRQHADDLLRTISQRLRDNLSPTDTVARMGWNQLAILSEEIRATGDLENLAARVRYVLSRPFSYSGQEISSNVNIGVAVSATGQENVDVLIQQAASETARAA